MLGEDDGLELGLEFQLEAPLTHIILMTGGGFSDELQTVCREREFPMLYKPFLAQDVLNLVRGRFSKANAAVAV
jgi:DNA-binding NtrC family response regulator